MHVCLEFNYKLQDYRIIQLSLGDGVCNTKYNTKNARAHIVPGNGRSLPVAAKGFQ